MKPSTIILILALICPSAYAKIIEQIEAPSEEIISHIEEATNEALKLVEQRFWKLNIPDEIDYKIVIVNTEDKSEVSSYRISNQYKKSDLHFSISERPREIDSAIGDYNIKFGFPGRMGSSTEIQYMNNKTYSPIWVVVSGESEIAPEGLVIWKFYSNTGMNLRARYEVHLLQLPSNDN
jgi:hypothetical protein